MNKLTLIKGRILACLILTCLLLAQACRKDRGYLPEPEINNGQLIQHTAIIKWFEASKYAQLLALDWKKARQGIVDGKNVVRIPTLNVDKITKLGNVPSLKNNSLSSNGISAGIANKTAATGNSGNINYNPAHPPELFLIQDGPSGGINSFLLNFIPKSKNSEAGENGIWSGKLLEWNLKGDTILVQQLEKSSVKDIYAMKVGASSPTNLSSIVKNNKLQSLTSIKDKQVSGFFGWLIDKLGEFVGWAGSAFGLSTYQYYTYDSYNDSFDGEWRLDIDFSWLTGSGTPTTTPGTPVTIPPRPLVMLYTGAGLPIYESYAIGYNGGGSSNPGSYNPNDPNNFEPSPIDYGDGQIDDQPHGPNVNFNNLSAQYLISQGWIVGDANILFINTHNEVADAFVAYTETIVNRTQSDIDFVNWAPGYLNDNGNISIEDFKTQFLSPTIFDNLTSSINAPDDPVIDNGIEIENLSGEAPSSGRLLATSPNRGNTEDMAWGTNGNTAGIRSSIISQTNAELFAHMDRLFEICSINDGEMQTVSADFINVFRNNTGGTFSHSTLNRKVQESSSYKNYIKGFGKQLLTKLQAVNGDINSVAQFNLNNRPIFSGLKNKFNGLQILINDTEQTDIKIDNYNIDTNGEFTVSLSVTIHDHFGLDKHDALTYQYKNLGFPAWWLLQHTRGYKPFETIINIKTRLHGHL
jgi:hypothetical protein